MITYLPAILTIAMIYGLLGLALNLNWGHTGIINFGHVAFFAIGAYTSALLNTKFSIPVPIGFAAGCIVAGLAAVPIGWITLRLKADFLAIVTIGFSETVRVVLEGSAWSGGPSGVTKIERPFADLPSDEFNLAWLAVFLVVVVAVFFLMRSITESQLGRVLRAIKADDQAVSMLGKNVAGSKTLSLVIAAALAGGAGALYAHYIGYISPSQFLPSVTFYVWAGIIIGGSSHLGALLGSVALIGLFEATRFLGDFGFDLISATDMANLRLIAVGVVIILFLKFRPNGLLPYKPSRRLVQRGTLLSTTTGPGENIPLSQNGPRNAGN